MNLPAEISVAQARLPEAYEAAKSALANCAALDECQAWADKAEALASYAKQADDDTLRQMADRIQARAVRRAGELLKTFSAQGQRTDRLQDGTVPKLSQQAMGRAAGGGGGGMSAVIQPSTLCARIGDAWQILRHGVLFSQDGVTLTTEYKGEHLLILKSWRGTPAVAFVKVNEDAASMVVDRVSVRNPDGVRAAS